jgi:fibronectin type 3 domain-containing protein/Flp pilus assembly pilin Flp
MTMLPRSTSARRPGGETGASIVEYAIIVVGVCAALVAVAWGLRSVMASSFTTAQTTIGQDRAALVLNHVGAIAPTHLTATAGDASIILTWDDMPASTSYTVTNCGTTSAPSLSGSTWTVLCTGLTNGTPYVVAVTATGPGGTSSPSTATATPQPPAPATPTAVTAVAGDRLITVTWNAMPNATSYTVTGCGSAVAYPTDRTQTGATCTGLTNGTTYSVSVTATNNGGSSSPSSPVTAVPHPPAPGAPTTLTATAGPASPTTITLQWAASTGATGYKVYGCTTPQPIVLATPVTTYTCTGLVTGTSYTVYVTATNLGGESAASPTATATPVAAPAAPTNLTATPGNRTIALTWGAMPGAASYSITGCGASITPSANPTGTAATCTLLTNGTTRCPSQRRVPAAPRLHRPSPSPLRSRSPAARPIRRSAWDRAGPLVSPTAPSHRSCRRSPE